MSQTNEALKVKLAQACQVLFMEGLAEDTTRGHITAKGEDGTIYIKPWGEGGVVIQITFSGKYT